MGKLSYGTAACDNDLDGAFEVRRQVFIREQGIPETLVFDDLEGEALQLVAKYEGQVVATARVRFLNDCQAKLERMAVIDGFRNRGIGKELVLFLENLLKDKKIKSVILHAQFDVVPFYRSCGFKQSGSPFREAGLRHLKMCKQIK